MNTKHLIVAFLGLSSLLTGLAQDATTTAPAGGASDADALAKKVANPVASLISLPIQVNVDFGIGPNDGWKSTTNIQPVIPMSAGKNWNIISRTILPVVFQNDVVGTSSQSGIGDVVQSAFFSPKEPGAGGLIWGIGPVLLIPTASSNYLGLDRWGAGPTAVVLKQDGKWTYGALANHIVDFAGSGSADLNVTFLNPFVAYALGGGRTFSANAEITRDWKSSTTTTALIASYSKVTKWGNQLVSIGGGAKVFVGGPDGGADWGLRFSCSFLFPK